MIDILKRIFIGVAIGMSIFFLKGIVAHAEVDFNFKEEKVLWNNNAGGTVRISQPNTAGGFNQIANLYFDTQFTNTAGYKYAVFYGTWLFYNTDNANFNYDLRLLTIQMNSSNAKASNCFFDGGTRLICPIVKNATYTKMSIYLPYNEQIYGITSGGGTTTTNFYLYYLLLKYVQFGDDQLSSGEQAIVDSITDDTDHSGNGNSYDNSGVSSNTDKEDSLTEDTDTLIEDFDIDLSSNARPFEYIFYLLDKFVKANIKVFGVILSLLGFGFVKLVIGR